MKNWFYFTYAFLIILLAACGSEPAIQPTQQAPTAAPPPTQTTVPPTETPVPTPTETAPPANILFRDDFEGALGEGWQWLGEDATHWNLTDAPGFLQIILQPCNIAADGRARNFLVRDVPDGDFQIETFVRFEPSSNFQFAGLLIYETQGKAMQFGRAFANCGFDACQGNAIYFDLADPGAVNPPNFVTPVDEPSQAWLRLVRKGNQYEGYYSADGEAWTMIGVHTSNIAPLYVGLIGSQAFEAETTADFDYFAIELIP